MKRIIDYFKEQKEYAQIYKSFCEQRSAKHPLPLSVTGLCEGARSAFCRCLLEDFKTDYDSPLLFITGDEKSAHNLHRSLNLYFNGSVYTYRDFMFHNVVSSHEYEYERLFILSSLLDNSLDYVITTPDALLQYTMPREILKNYRLIIKENDVLEQNELIEYLISVGYSRSETVEGKGQFSVRGGIIDIFSPSLENPVRIEYFDNEIDSVYYFDIMTQRRTDHLGEFTLCPCREVIISTSAKQNLLSIIEKQIKNADSFEKKSIFKEELQSINNSNDIYFIDKYITAVYTQPSTLMDYFDKNIPFVSFETNAIKDRLKSYEYHLEQTYKILSESGVDNSICEYGGWSIDYENRLYTSGGIICNSFLTSSIDTRLFGIFNFITKQTPYYADKFDILYEESLSYLRNGYFVYISCENKAGVDYTVKYFDDKGITALKDTDPCFGKPAIIEGNCEYCFELPAVKFVLLSTTKTNSKTGALLRKAHRKLKKKDSRESIMSYADLNVGDYVVSDNHGIGQYLGLSSLVVDSVRRDFVKIKYAGSDILYLPCDQLDSISKYIGARYEDGTVKLSKMGGKEWTTAKAKAKKAATEMAKELIKLYAERMRREGFAFEVDDDFQAQFEEGFEYEETDGQLIAVEEIKRDMESPHPMDRLLCGDVGFGKTEVALRAAFKAINNSKQVAVLVPTTILAMQHYQTILSRMRGFPIKVGILSRFSTPKQIKETLEGLKSGKIEIVVGTHRMISKDVEFKDLGLVIVDEEQRFGVAQKEKLKQISYNVDVLTLTATPIPRTLNMAMSGIRDMSILEEAPGDRLPVQSYVLEFDEKIIGEAINKELRRGGQVFYLYNRVDNINRVAERVAALAPEAKIAVAHGQMDKDDLSDIWQQMVSGEIDILVSTTIIETGIDIPNANTLIIENSDKMGLSQLHQIRGRIGRSARRAYAYFTYPRGKVLSEISEKRLSAVREYTQFGSGFKIALRDLEIRGAGNLLGAEQHGNIESVGYDLYVKILNQAILEEKGEIVRPKPECTIDIKINAYIPENYISSPASRIEAYKRIASIKNEEDLSDVMDELIDRYGDIPISCENLCLVSFLRSLGSDCEFDKIVSSGKSINIYPKVMDVKIWTQLASERKGKILLNLSTRPYATYRTVNDSQPIEKVCALLCEYLQIIKNGENNEEE